MDELQWLDINRKLDIIIAQTGKKGQTPFGDTDPLPPQDTRKQWEIDLERRGWSKETFAKQVKQREPGWPESLVALAGCWSLAGGASQALVDLIAEFKADNQELFVKE